MTAIEKAVELVNKYYNEIKYMERAKACALIAVDEILDKDGYNNDYWHEVKQEIQNL